MAWGQLMCDADDLYLDERLQKLETLIAANPDHPEARRARRLVRRARFYQMRGLLQNAPRAHRYLLADVRAASRDLERNAP